MPKLTRARSLFTCYNPAIRRKQWPNYEYRHLVRCARNLAAAFDLAHAHRYVIGDANESNVFVSGDCLVSLIDCDSWQVSDGCGRIYRSPVAKSDFLPPELQNTDLQKFDRQPCHDNFALAVLLFKLLNEGCHPFDGVYHGTGDVPVLEARIASGAFPYRDQSGRWSRKGTALPFDALHPCLQKLFLQAFEIGHARPQSRPNAQAWQTGLALAESELHGCQCNSHHWFWADQCPWCERKVLLDGHDPFPAGRTGIMRSVTRAARTVTNPVHIHRTKAKNQPTPSQNNAHKHARIPANPIVSGSGFPEFSNMLTYIAQEYDRAFALWSQNWLGAVAGVVMTTSALIVGIVVHSILIAWAFVARKIK